MHSIQSLFLEFYIFKLKMFLLSRILMIPDMLGLQIGASNIFVTIYNVYMAKVCSIFFYLSWTEFEKIQMAYFDNVIISINLHLKVYQSNRADSSFTIIMFEMKPRSSGKTVGTNTKTQIKC